MQYLGGKAGISGELSGVINPFLWGGADFVSLFCGSCAVEAKINAQHKILNDAHPQLIAMWQGLSDGTLVLPDEISREQYYDIKKNGTPALQGFVGFGCSFLGKWWGGYAVGKETNGTYRNFATVAKSTTLRDFEGLRGATFICGDYRAVKIPSGAVVYCDPPYEGKTGYSVEKFDMAAFWEWVRTRSKQNLVFVSSEKAPPDFRAVWEKDKRRDTDKVNGNTFYAKEKLFVINKREEI